MNNAQFIVGDGKYSAQSIARSVLAVEQMPVALVLDADTTDTAAIQEQYEFLRFSLHQASPDVPCEVFLAVPKMEVLLVQDIAFLKRLSHKSQLSEIEVAFAKLHPKKFLLTMTEQTLSYAIILQDILKHLDSQTLQVIQQHPLVQQLSDFVLSVVEPVPA